MDVEMFEAVRFWSQVALAITVVGVVLLGIVGTLRKRRKRKGPAEK